MFRLWLTTILVMLVFACAPHPPVVTLPPDVVVTVGTKQITWAEVELMAKGLEESGRRFPEDIVVKNKIMLFREGPNRTVFILSELQQEALEELIAQELLYQEAQRRNIQISEQDISGHLDVLWREFLSREEFEDKQREYGLDETGLRQQIGRELAIARLLNEEVYAKMVIGDEELVKRPQEVHELYIYRRTFPGAPQARRQEVWEKMREALGRLEAGEDFAQVAREYSQSGLAQYGGDAGFVTFSPNSEISKALFALQEGQISEIIETRWGLYILKAEKIKPETIETYGQLSPKLRRIVFQRCMQKRLEEFIEELRQKADVQMAS